MRATTELVWRLGRAAFLAFCLGLVWVTAPPVAHATPPAASAAHDGKPESKKGAAHDAPGEAEGGDSIVRIRDRKVFEIKTSRAGVSAVERAKRATKLLEAAVDEKEEPNVRVEETADPGVVVVLAGKSPIAQLGLEDAAAAGDASLKVHAGTIVTKTRDAVRAERRRKAAAEGVFSVSLLVFSALVAFLLLRKIGELAGRARTWFAENPDRLPLLRIQGIDLVSPGTFRGGVAVALGGGQLLGQVGIVYAWALFSLSLFESTRGYTATLSKAVTVPLTDLTQRVATSVPILIVVGVTGFAVMLLMRFAGLFFGSVARGDTHLEWLPRDLAIHTGVLARAALVLLALLVGIPLVTGSQDGALSRAGLMGLVALGIAATPLLATAVVGVVVVYGRRLRVGEEAELGGRRGKVAALDLFEVRLEDPSGCEVRVPYLLTLIHPTRVLGRTPPAVVSISVSPRANQTEVRRLLEVTAMPFGHDSTVEIVSFDEQGARYAVTVRGGAKGAAGELLFALADALSKANVPLAVAPAAPVAQAGSPGPVREA